jgi:hypothetical protein
MLGEKKQLLLGTMSGAVDCISLSNRLWNNAAKEQVFPHSAEIFITS